jgi:hypothetical protein
MRAVLIGTDFVYDETGRLLPLEINTNVGMENFYLENDDEIFDFAELLEFIRERNIRKVTYLGALRNLDAVMSKFLKANSIEYQYVRVLSGNLTVPDVEDNDQILIIRSAYDTTAIVDDVYCKNKVNFMKMIANSSYGSEFAYMNEDGELVNGIKTIRDNGDNPNFILKSVYPRYDKEVYPKLYRVETEEELNMLLENVNSSYFLMPYYYSERNLHENQVKVIRSLNMLFPPDLKSVRLGSYIKLADRKNEEPTLLDPDTHEVLLDSRRKYLTSDKAYFAPKLLDDDEVEMADGTFKTGYDLQVGDVVKSLIIPNPNDVDLEDDLAEFGITYEEFVAGVLYSQNTVTMKKRADRISEYVTIYFEDGTDWADTAGSSYILDRDGIIQFERIESLVNGDRVVLVDTSSDKFASVEKIVDRISVEKLILSGWEITVEERHVFLTRNGSEGNQSFAAIEHNISCSGKRPCGTKACTGKKSCTTTISGTFCECRGGGPA